MPLPETDVARVRRWIAGQNEEIGEHIGEMRIEMDVDPRAITIFEARPPWADPGSPEWTRQEIARLRYTATRKVWALYWPDRNSRFHRYDLVAPTANVQLLLDEITADPTCIFSG